MYVVFVLVAALVVFAIAAVVTGRVPAPPPAIVDRPGPELPEGPVQPRDVHDLQFALALRGYRMDQVDAVLDRLADEVAARDAEIVRLRAAAGGAVR